MRQPGQPTSTATAPGTPPVPAAAMAQRQTMSAAHEKTTSRSPCPPCPNCSLSSCGQTTDREEKRRGDNACHGLRIMHRGPRTSGASQSLRAPRLASRWHGGDMQVCPRTWTLWRTAASPLPPLPPPPRRTGSTSTTSPAGLRHPRRRSCRPARTAHSSRGRSGPAERTAGDLPAGPRSSETCPSTRRANSTLTSARTESERE